MTGGVREVGPSSTAGTRGPLTRPTPAQRRHVLVLGALILAGTVTSVLAAFANPGADEGAYRTIRGWDWLGTWPSIGGTATALVLVAAAGTVVLLGWRCRTYLAVAAGALAVTLPLGWVLSRLVARDRPVEFEPGGTDSYPAMAALVLTVVVGLLPLALRSLGVRAVVRRILTTAAVLVVVLFAVTQVHAGMHWPMDEAGAAMLGTALTVVARLVMDRPSRHPWCRWCPWQQDRSDLETAPVAVPLSPRGARVVHRVALVWVTGIVVAYALLAVWWGLPRSPESGVMGSGLEVPLQWGLLTVLVLGVLVARRLHLLGAMMVAFAATLLGYASSVQYPPWIGVTVATVAWVPALLLWLEWHRRASVRGALAAAVATSVVLGLVAGAAATTYSAYWGPTHPRSATAAPPTDVVEWMWSGAVTSSRVAVRLRTAADARSVRLLVSPDEDLSGGTTTSAVRPDADRVAALDLDGLSPGTRYHYAAEVDGRLASDRVQSFRTFPEGAADFSFVVGACQLGGSNGRVFDSMRATDPLFFLSTGDWTYGNVERDKPSLFQAQYDLNLTAPAQAALYAQAPIAYVWGDHDFGGNDADRSSTSRPAAMAVYRQMTPHYPLAEDPESPIYQAFTVGRVRFVVTDTRAGRDPADDVAGSLRSTLGTEQREWLLTELARADRYGLVVWVNPDPWVAQADPTADNWGGFAEERQLIADAIADQEVDNLLMLSGDAHMVAFDDGTNTDYSTTDYSTTGSAGFPLLHAGAIDRPGSVKGGPYSGRVIPGGGQYGAVDIRDDGTTVEATLTARSWESAELFTEVLRFPSSR